MFAPAGGPNVGFDTPQDFETAAYSIQAATQPSDRVGRRNEINVWHAGCIVIVDRYFREIALRITRYSLRHGIAGALCVVHCSSLVVMQQNNQAGEPGGKIAKKQVVG